MKKVKIEIEEVIKYQHEFWRDYAAQTIRDKRARFQINLVGDYKITYDEEVIYEGSSLYDAIEAWDSV